MCNRRRAGRESAGAAGGAPTITNGIAGYTVGDNAPTPNTFDVDTLVTGGVANIDPSSLTIVTPAPAGDATSTLASSSSHGLITTTFAVDGSGNTLATGTFSLTFGVCAPGTATYSATNPTCSTGTLTYEPISNQNMGDEFKSSAKPRTSMKASASPPWSRRPCPRRDLHLTNAARASAFRPASTASPSTTPMSSRPSCRCPPASPTCPVPSVSTGGDANTIGPGHREILHRNRHGL